MANRFVFDGISSEEMGLVVSNLNAFSASGRNPTTYRIPGALGEYYPDVEDDDTRPNEIRTYSCALYRARDMEAQTAAIKRWLMQKRGYLLLEDSYEPNVFRKAYFTGGFDGMKRGAGRNISFDAQFSCLPQRFLQIGKVPTQLSAESGLAVFSNPFGYKSFPLIEVGHAQDLPFVITISFYRGGPPLDGGTEVGKIVFDFTDALYDGITFDCETTEAWFTADPSVSANAFATPTGDLSLPDEVTAIAVDVPTGVTVWPNWWRL